MAHGQVPEYAVQSLNDLLSYLENASTLLQASKRAITALRDIPGLYLSLANTKKTPETKKQFDDEWEQSKKDAVVGLREYEQGFPFLHDFTLVGMWGALEASVEDLMVALLSHEPELLRRDAFSKIKVSLADYETLSKDERMRLVVSELGRALRADQRQGVSAFESILDSVGLSGRVDEDLREAVWEMNHVRNVIVHRRSRVDRSFRAACPKFGISVGDRLIVTSDYLERYKNAVHAYAVELLGRIKARYAADAPPQGAAARAGNPQDAEG